MASQSSEKMRPHGDFEACCYPGLQLWGDSDRGFGADISHCTALSFFNEVNRRDDHAQALPPYPSKMPCKLTDRG